jgi:hypothetical protein
MKPPADTAGEPHADGISASLPSLVTNNWRWFATAAAALLLGGATWKSRSAWLHAARKMWSR